MNATTKYLWLEIRPNPIRTKLATDATIRHAVTFERGDLQALCGLRPVRGWQTFGVSLKQCARCLRVLAEQRRIVS